MEGLMESSFTVESSPLPIGSWSKYGKVAEAAKGMKPGEWFYATAPVTDRTERQRLHSGISSAARRVGCSVRVVGKRIVVYKK